MGYTQQANFDLTDDETTTPEIPIGGAKGGSLDIPSTASLDLLEYYGSNDGTTYAIIRDALKNAVQTDLTASTVTRVNIPEECFGRAWLRIKAAADVSVVLSLDF